MVPDQVEWMRSPIGSPSPESKLWTSAVYMFERYGESAQDEALRRADEMSISGDIAGEATWTTIGQYLDEMMKRPSWLPTRRLD